jgi:hypothetical protein
LGRKEKKEYDINKSGIPDQAKQKIKKKVKANKPHSIPSKSPRKKQPRLCSAFANHQLCGKSDVYISS